MTIRRAVTPSIGGWIQRRGNRRTRASSAIRGIASGRFSTGTWIRTTRRCIHRRGEGKPPATKHQPQSTLRALRFLLFIRPGQKPKTLRTPRTPRLHSICTLWLFSVLLSAQTAIAQPQPVPRPAADMPRVRLVATGGTISNRNGGRLTAEDLVNAMPGVDQFAKPEYEQFANVASSQLTLDQWLGLSKRINELLATDGGLAGVVVTS